MLDSFSETMERKAFSAVFLSLIMMLSGCLGSDEPAKDDSVEEKSEEIVANLTMELTSSELTVGDIAIVSAIVDISPAETTYYVESDIITPSGLRDIETTSSRVDNGFRIIFMPDEPGLWAVNSRLVINGLEDSIKGGLEFSVSSPDEGFTVLSVNPVFEMSEAGVLILTGTVEHSNPSSCSISDGNANTSVSNDGYFSLNQGFVQNSYNISITATCGQWTQSQDSRTVKVIVTSSNDMDGDGIPDDADQCPNGYGEDEGWFSDSSTDMDSDGCHDIQEDRDDDGDLIPDVDDSCISQIGWESTSESDHDSDGCADSTEDLDDDNDGVMDVDDLCPKGEIGWESKTYTDYDADGCQDYSEDTDDDNDMVEDAQDACWRGLTNWTSNSNFDYDGDGCNDLSEDLDDDNDGVNDLNETGIILDQCPRTPLDAHDVDENGCDATERDTDGDGVFDSDDNCPGTPIGNNVNSIGCADLDGDGIFSNVDDCPNTLEKWTPNSEGCAVYQMPVSWSQNGYGNGRMDIVADFTVPTLDGTWSFSNEWTGNDVYLFLFKYTDSSGNGNNADWSRNPGSMIRQLPDNAHLFYGSFDSTYNNDVKSRKNAVENTLNADEELKWENRIHYIDMDMSNAGGGLGDLISNWNSLYYGIDRFQRAREIGSIYAWTSQTNDITHWAYETRMYNYEFKTEVRETDPSIHSVTIVDNVWHSGGWSGGYTSTYENVSISLPNNISSYDTLEVFHEHACEDRRNRYQKSDGGYGGCHEWDYLAYMKICDRDNSSKCGTEFMRWITTYGREGRWITDISPYLFMLQDNDVRNFKYQGANKGDMTVKLLFSNWGVGERSISGERVFTGGQFAGEYNNESMYKRQHNFTAIDDYYSVKIVSTITGHGFNQDQANCAEFCDHEHHYYLNGNHAYEWHPIVYDNQGCEKEVDRGVVANQFGSWPFGRAGWCAGQDVKQWTYDITDWIDNSTTNNLQYKGLYNGQEYVPQNTNGGSREIRANIWLVWYAQN